MTQIPMRKELIFVLAFISKVVFPAAAIKEVDDIAKTEDLRRPIWNIAHMVNSIKQVDEYIDRGANALEFDITFNSDGTASKVYHGIPCDCFRICTNTDDFSEYIDNLRQLTTPGDPRFREELVFLFLDLKVSKLTQTTLYRAGQDIATKLLDHYWKGTSDARAYILVSIPSYKDMAFIRGFRNTLEEKNATNYYSKLAYDFSENEDLGLIEAAIEAEGLLDAHIWIGDGITNCFPRGTSRLFQALEVRDRAEKPFLRKVYWWTVDRMSTMKKTLSMGIDGLITNHPERLIRVMNEDEMTSQVRLATIDDCPWKNYPQITAKMLGSPESAKANVTVLYNIQKPTVDYL